MAIWHIPSGLPPFPVEKFLSLPAFDIYSSGAWAGLAIGTFYASAASQRLLPKAWWRRGIIALALAGFIVDGVVGAEIHTGPWAELLFIASLMFAASSAIAYLGYRRPSAFIGKDPQQWSQSDPGLGGKPGGKTANGEEPAG